MAALDGVALAGLAAELSHHRAQIARLEGLLTPPPTPEPATPSAAAAGVLDAASVLPPPPSPPPPPGGPLALDSLLDFRSALRMVCLLTLPFLLLLLLESYTARYALGGHAFATSMHLKHLLVPPLHGAAGAAAAAGSSSSSSSSGSSSARALPLRPDTVGGLLVAFRNPRAVLRVMRQYREAYPEGDLVIGCDDGCYNFSAAAAHYGAHWDGVPRRLTTKTDPGWYVRPPQATAFVRALGEWLPRIRSPRYMVLETDVFLERRVASPLNFTMCGCVCPPTGWFIGGESVYAEKLNPSYHPSHWKDGKVFYGGQGGSILSTRFMAAIARQPKEHLDNDLALFFGCSTTVGIDYFVSALVHRYNGSVGEYAGYLNWPGEGSVGRFAAGSIEALHPDKTEYGQPLSPEDLEVLGPHWETPLTVPASAPREAPRVHDQCTWEAGVRYRWGDSGLREDALARGEAWPPEGFGSAPRPSHWQPSAGGGGSGGAGSGAGARRRLREAEVVHVAQGTRQGGRGGGGGE